MVVILVVVVVVKVVLMISLMVSGEEYVMFMLLFSWLEQHSVFR